jgi:tRNA G37 N-methylase TrmD
MGVGWHGHDRTTIDASLPSKSERSYDEIIYMSPDGETLNQKMANTMSMYENIIILCGL